MTPRQFMKVLAFAKFKNEISCVDLAYVEKLVQKNDRVKYVLVRQDLFNRTVDANKMIAKSFQRNVSCNFNFDF